MVMSYICIVGETSVCVHILKKYSDFYGFVKSLYTTRDF